MSYWSTCGHDLSGALMHDNLGQRIKSSYEDRTRFMLPRRTYAILRLDGKAFHSFKGHFKAPYDQDLRKAMCVATNILLYNMQGAAFAYVQSDEISVLLTDFATTKTEAWFDGNIQKIVSIAASILSVNFNYILDNDPLSPSGLAEIAGKAYFDARVFTIPDRVEVENYFIWRQKDCERNAINGVGQHLFSTKELHGKSVKEVREMIANKGTPITFYPPDFQYGTIVLREQGHNYCLPAPHWTLNRDDLVARIPNPGYTDGN